MTLGTSPTFHFICYIVPYMNIYGLGVGISLVSKFSNRRGRLTPGIPPIFHLISYIGPYMNIYCFGVGISTVSKFSNRRVGMTTGTSLIFHLICYIVPYMSIYGLGVRILTISKFSNRRVNSDLRDSPYLSFELLYCPVHEYIWLRGGDLNGFQILKQEGVG